MEVDRQDLVLACLAETAGPTGPGMPLAAIPAAIGVSSNRISERVELMSVLDRLQHEGLIESLQPDDTDGGASVRFRLTENGQPRAKAIRSNLLDTTIEIVNGDHQTLSISAAANRLNLPGVAIAAETTADDIYYLDSTPEPTFVGREPALEAGKDLLEATRDGEGQVLLVAGPPGVGKTSLVDHVLTAAPNLGVEVLRARAHAAGAVAYQPLRDIVTEFAADPFSETSPAASEADALHAQQTALFDDLTETLIQRSEDGTGSGPGSPHAVFIDDLHLADKGTLAYLDYLIDRVQDYPLLVVGSYRPAELAEATPGSPAQIEDGSVTHVKVTPFDCDGTRRLLEAVLETRGIPGPFVEAIHDRTGGNPLFVEAVVETLLETAQLDPEHDVYPESADDMDVPGEVRTTIDHHVQQFPASARDLLRWAAVLGEQFDPDVLLALADVSETQFRTYMELFVDGAVFDRTDAGLAFRSEVLREALLEKLAEADRRHRHQQVATVLTERVTDTDAVTVAHHHERAANHDRAIAAYQRAADDATAVYAHEAAIDHLRDALALAREANDQEAVVSLATEVAAVYETIGEYDDARRFAQFARERAMTDDQRCRALVRLSAVANRHGDHKRAIDLTTAGLERDGDDTVDCRLLGQLCLAQEQLGRYEGAQTTAQRRRRIAADIGDDTQLAAAITQRGTIAASRGEYERARESHQTGLKIHRTLGDRHAVAESLTSLGHVAREQGEYGRAREYYERSLDVLREVGDRHGVAETLKSLGIVSWEQANYDEGREYTEKSLAIHRELGDRHGVAKTLNNLGIVAWEQGGYEQAKAHFEESLSIYREVGDRHGVAKCLGNLGLVMRALDKYKPAREYHEESLDTFRDLGARHGVAKCLCNLGIICWRQSKYEQAQEYLEESRQIFRAIDDRHGVATNLGHLGVVAQKRQEYERARTYLDEAIEEARAVGDPPLTVGCLAHRAVVAFESERDEVGLTTGERALSTGESAGIVSEDLDPVRAVRDMVQSAIEAGHPATARQWSHRAISILEGTSAEGRCREFQRALEQTSPTETER